MFLKYKANVPFSPPSQTVVTYLWIRDEFGVKCVINIKFYYNNKVQIISIFILNEILSKLFFSLPICILSFTILIYSVTPFCY